MTLQPSTHTVGLKQKFPYVFLCASPEDDLKWTSRNTFVYCYDTWIQGWVNLKFTWGGSLSRDMAPHPWESVTRISEGLGLASPGGGGGWGNPWNRRQQILRKRRELSKDAVSYPRRTDASQNYTRLLFCTSWNSFGLVATLPVLSLMKPSDQIRGILPSKNKICIYFRQV